jgi:hypothetical protein
LILGEVSRVLLSAWIAAPRLWWKEVASVNESDVAVPAEESLVYHGDVFINFRTTRQWVSIKLFALMPDMDDRTVMARLIQHVRYRDSYAEPAFKDAENIHGPYWLSAISAGSFAAVSAADAETLIRTWANYTEPPTGDIRSAMEHEAYQRIRGATKCYQLPDMRDTAQHDWGYVVGSDGFYELVLINRNSSSVALLVASDD